MQKVLSFLEALSDSDINWIFSAATERYVDPDAVLIQEGTSIASMYFVLEGSLGIFIAAADQQIAVSGPGDILGETSFVENIPASASVVAVEKTHILELPQDVLDQKLQSDPELAARFYKAIAILISQRLRSSRSSFADLTRPQTSIDLPESTAWNALSPAIQQFKELLSTAEQQARKNDTISDEYSENIQRRFAQFAQLMNDTIGDQSPEDTSVKEEIGRRLHQETLPYVLLTRWAERAYAKPRGYAGDFLTIEMLYKDIADGSGRIGPILDRCFLNEPAAKAVRNRKDLLAEEIQAVLSKKENETAYITSLACGPAEEIFTVFQDLEERTRLKASLIDFDLQALASVSDRRDALKLRSQMDLINENLIYLALGRKKLQLREQDFMYSIGLIDYFDDRLVTKLINFCHALLKPGGKLMLGNFHPKNPTKALMDYILDWKLIHRTEEDMNRLFAHSKFESPCTNIRFEGQGINLFAECTKQ